MPLREIVTHRDLANGFALDLKHNDVSPYMCAHENTYVCTFQALYSPHDRDADAGFEPALVDASSRGIPRTRQESRLVIFGGWANKWLEPGQDTDPMFQQSLPKGAWAPKKA